MKQDDYFLARLQAEADSQHLEERVKRIWNLIHITNYCVQYKAIEIPANYQN